MNDVICNSPTRSRQIQQQPIHTENVMFGRLYLQEGG